MYLKKAFDFLHEPWRYIVGFCVIFVVWQLGTLPLMFSVIMKTIRDGGTLADLEGDPTIFMTTLDSNMTLFLTLLSFAIGLLSLILWVRGVHKQDLLSLTTTRKKVDWGRVLFGFGLIAVTTIFFTVLDYNQNPDDYVLQFEWGPFLILFAIALVMLPLQTSFEEYLFRGYLMQGIGTMAKNRWVPLLITSVIFGGLHILNPEVDKIGYIIMVFYIGTGLLLGIMTLMDEGMELALGFHAGNNLVAALLVSADWTAFQTSSILKDISEPNAGVDVLMPVLIVYPIFLGILAWRYKWKGWREKLLGRVDPPEALVVDPIEENRSS